MRPSLTQKSRHRQYHRQLLAHVCPFSARNPYISEEDQEEEEKKDAVTEKGKKNKNKDKGQNKKLLRNKPMLVDVDLGLSAYANAKK